MKKIFFTLIFTFYLNRDTSVVELFPVVFWYKKEKFSMRSVLTHLLVRAIKIISKLLDCNRKIENYVYSDMYYCKPELSS